jgi:hypothetical protein
MKDNFYWHCLAINLQFLPASPRTYSGEYAVRRGEQMAKEKGLELLEK